MEKIPEYFGNCPFIIQYVRKSKCNREKKGVLIAYLTQNKMNVAVGFSLCHKKDVWDRVQGKYFKNFGLGIAIARAQKSLSNNEIIAIPKSLITPLKQFYIDIKKRWGDKIFPEWIDKL